MSATWQKQSSTWLNSDDGGYAKKRNPQDCFLFALLRLK